MMKRKSQISAPKESRGKRILMIDDEKDFTELASKFLRVHHFEVNTLNEFVQIEEALKSNQYDLIVTDLMMPQIDGFQFIKMLRRNKVYENTPVIVLSVKSLSDEERKMLLKYHASFLTKPFQPQAFADHVIQMLTASPAYS
jgi:DNA-binding response OmpR family regulator